ncbi:MAG: hypothetical protein E7655_01445 [Ruminococcaceae bacterium]|nr:hypothetical protein [Oscillospiraceae bacterium]
MNEFSIPMALVDFIPVLFFALASILLMSDLYHCMSKGAFALFSAGVIDVTIAGALKAAWKLMYAAGLCNFEALDAIFFPVQSIGFLLAGIGMLTMLVQKKSNASLLAAAPPVFSGTFVFVGLMVAGLGILDAVLCILCGKQKKPALIALFALSFLCSLCMGYLSSRDFAQASMNWIAEGVNVVGQGTFLVGTVLLHKSGLSTVSLRSGGESA